MTTQTTDSLLSALGQTLQGSLHTDTVMKTLYATDASAYREMPLGVAIPETKEDLEKIIHPRVQATFAEVIEDLEHDDILIYEIPLLAETDAAEKFDYIITVESDIENRLDRLFERGMDEDEAERRIAAQASQAEREAVADRVIVNDGDRAELFAECARIWESELNASR